MLFKKKKQTKQSPKQARLNRTMSSDLTKGNYDWKNTSSQNQNEWDSNDTSYDYLLNRGAAFETLDERVSYESVQSNSSHTQHYPERERASSTSSVTSSQQTYYRLLSTRMNWTKGLPSKGKFELFCVTIGIFVIMLVLFWQINPIRKVNNLVVQGESVASETAILQASGISHLETVKSVLNRQSDIVESIQSANPTIEQVELIREDWKSLIIQVKDYEIVGVVEENGLYYPLLSSGDMLAMEISDAQRILDWIAYPVVISPNYKGQLQTIAGVLKQISPEIREKIDRIALSTNLNQPNRIELLMKDGLYVKGNTVTLAEKIVAYDKMKQLIGDQKGTINLEVGAYFTPEIDTNQSIKLDANLNN